MTPLTAPPTTTARRTGPEQWFHTTATLCLVQLLVCLWPVGWYVVADLTVETDDGVGLRIAAATSVLLLVLAVLVRVAVVLERGDRRRAARWVLAPLVALTGVACAVVGPARPWRDRR